MSRRGLARHAARRDANEGEIRKRFAFHGWHTEQVSGKGLPDLLCWPRYYPIGQEGRRSIAVDVKTPKGTLKPTQVKKWTALHALGIPVYVVRTEADVDALVGGTLAPWEPTPVPLGTLRGKRAIVAELNRRDAARPRKGDAAKARAEAKGRAQAEAYGVVCDPDLDCVPPHIAANRAFAHSMNNYTPPRSKPVGAAKRVSGLGSEMMVEMLKPPGEENYDAALKRAMGAAREAEATFAAATPGGFVIVPSLPCCVRYDAYGEHAGDYD